MRNFIFPRMFCHENSEPPADGHYEVPDDIEDCILLMGARELQCLQLQCCGWNRQQMAARLKISKETVSSHLKRAYGRLGTTNFAQVMIVGFELGWIETKAIRRAREAEIERLAKASLEQAELRELRH
ncbi:MAG: response regulator transcription factor [Pirellulales bacterium]